MKKKVAVILVLIIIAVFIAGCGSNPDSSKNPGVSSAQGIVRESDVSFAGPMVDNMLAGIKERDYAKFSRDFSRAMKDAIDISAFNSLADLLQTKIGDFQSIAFGQAANTTQNGIPITTIVYTAKYSKESADVLITVSFSADNGTKQIAGLLFNSPNLRQQ